MTSRITGALAVAGALLALGACGEPQGTTTAQDEKLNRLVAAVEDLTAAQRDLAETVRRQNRHLSTLGREMAIQGPDGGAVAADPTSPEGGVSTAGAGAVGSGADAAETAAAGAVERVLASEAGRQAIERAAAAEVERRETQERRTFVSFTIGRFARDAGLDERQTDALQSIWKDSLDQGVELRREFAALREVPEAERPAAREKVMETMRAIGRDRNERIGALLTQTQLEQYGPVEDEIVEAMHGGPRRAPASGRPPAR